MDLRKKQIEELEKKKRENSSLLDVLLVRLGEAVLGRLPDSDPSATDETSLVGEGSVFDEIKIFRRLQNDIANSQVSSQAAEEQIHRFKELEAKIEAGEREENACLKNISASYGKLGKSLLNFSQSYNGTAYEENENIPSSGDGETSDYGYIRDFCSPYQDQSAALLSKVVSLEERLSELEHRDGGNVFTWIGKSTQSLVLRSFLTKAKENLEQLYRTVGDRFSRRSPADELPPVSAGIRELCDGIDRKRSESLSVSQDLAKLKEEKHGISGSFSADGGPHKHIQALKNHIAGFRDELRALYRRTGAEAISRDKTGDEKPAEYRQFIKSLLMPEDNEISDKAARISGIIREDDASIEKLKASLAIDDEKARIEKFRRMIHDKKDKIAQAEKSIAEFEKNIGESEETIEKLQNLL